ncbi:hypothetical protein KTE51_30035, partial [Burkholderia multivorans]|nr:hypothetical protein [Burkholderia multivorans]
CPKFVINDWLTHLLGPSVTMAKVNRMLKKLTALGLFLKPSLRAFGVDAMRCKAAVDFSRNHLASWSADVPGYWTEHSATLDKPVKQGRAAPVRKKKS